ncbi:MAG: Coq4 family protein [Deltaproteobacteria bacterium]|nr:Coq4 family protein [Deltaproteobacteria bacterium]
MHDAIRTALLHKVEDLDFGGPTMAPVLEAIATHGDCTVREALPLGGSTGPAGEGPFEALERQAASAAAGATFESLLWIAVHTLRVGFVTPEAALPVYERLANGWLRGKASIGYPLLAPPAPPLDASVEADALPLLRRPGRVPEGLPALLWQVVGQQVDPATITPTIAAFGATYGETLKDACARAIRQFPGQDVVAAQPWPPRVDIHSLAACPPDTLGHAYYHLIVDNGFDPEVLDPDTVTGFHPGVDGTNRRILQQHELWHLVAGYSTSPLHESAISSFQLAQFGHNYSAAFLGTIITLLLFSQPIFLDPFLQVTAEAWRHGRATPPMMLIDWQAQWGKSIAAIRAEFGVGSLW